MNAALEKIDFPNFREGWVLPPGVWKSHFVFRIELTNTVKTACGTLTREIDHYGNGINALWAEGSFERCKTCQRMNATR